MIESCPLLAAPCFAHRERSRLEADQSEGSRAHQHTADVTKWRRLGPQQKQHRRAQRDQCRCGQHDDAPVTGTAVPPARLGYARPRPQHGRSAKQCDNQAAQHDPGMSYLPRAPFDPPQTGPVAGARQSGSLDWSRCHRLADKRRGICMPRVTTSMETDTRQWVALHERPTGPLRFGLGRQSFSNGSFDVLRHYGIKIAPFLVRTFPRNGAIITVEQFGSELEHLRKGQIPLHFCPYR